ncbi:MAG: dihydrodipicolinate synthase family protein [Gammaproteobacteria bacterium]|jgi:4-hydroxy-tetrahydrodipicolinate synthase|nr:dihydrodipicolinate synthase family protein [Gammaproteobacteria bacterium]
MAFNEQSHGVYVIAPTPFQPDGTVDTPSIDSMMDFYLRCGVAGITVLGIMGEAPKLEPAESLAIVQQVIARAAGRPVIVGVSAPGFAGMRSLAHASMDAGAAGVMIAPPPSLRTDEQITTYFRQAVEAIGADIPWVLQDHPLMLSVVMTPKVIRQIIQDHPSCRMLKHEDWPGLEKISALRGFEQDGSMRHVSILCGNGGLFLDFELGRGADGGMTGYAFPDMLVELVERHRRGDRDGVHDLFDAHLPFLRYEHQTGPGLAVRKYVLMRRGAIRHDIQRKPGSALTSAARAEVDYLLARLARRDSRAAI